MSWVDLAWCRFKFQLWATVVASVLKSWWRLRNAVTKCRSQKNIKTETCCLFVFMFISLFTSQRKQENSCHLIKWNYWRVSTAGGELGEYFKLYDNHYGNRLSYYFCCKMMNYLPRHRIWHLCESTSVWNSLWNIDFFMWLSSRRNFIWQHTLNLLWISGQLGSGVLK